MLPAVPRAGTTSTLAAAGDGPSTSYGPSLTNRQLLRQRVLQLRRQQAPRLVSRSLCYSGRLTVQPTSQAASTGQQVSGFQLTIPDAEDPQHFVLHGEQGELQAGGPGVASHQLERAMAASSVRGLHALLEPSLVKHHLRPVTMRLLQLCSEQHGSEVSSNSSSRGQQPSQASSSQAAVVEQARACMTDICQHVQGSLHTLQPEELACIAEGLTRLQLHDAHMTQQLVAASWQQAPSMSASSAASLVWALSRSYKQFRPAAPQPPEAWVNALLDRVAAGAAACSPGTLVQALHAAALLRHSPSPAWMETMLLHVSVRLQQFQGCDIAGLLWALATLGHNPGHNWVDAVLRRAEQCVRTFGTGPSVSTTLWALATIGHAPTASWMEHFLWQVQRRLNVCDAQGLANVAWALAKLHYRPNAAWTTAFLKAAAQRMHATQAHEKLRAAKTRGAGSRGGSRPALFTVQGTAADTQQSQTAASSNGASRNGAAGTGAESGAAGSSGQGGGAGQVAPQAYANLLWALAKLNLSPRTAYLQRMCSAMAAALPRFSPRDLAHVLWALQRLRCLPGHDWMFEVHVALHARLRHFDTPSLVVVLSALGGFADIYRVDPSLLSALCLHLAPRVPRLDPSSTVAVCVALARLCGPGELPRPLHEQLLGQVDRHMGLLTVRQAANTAWALSRLAQRSSDVHLRSGLSLLPRLLDVGLRGGVQRCNTADLAQFLEACSRVGFHPGSEWLDAHEAACARLVARGLVSEPEVRVLLRSYEELEYGPSKLESALRERRAQRLRAAREAAAAVAASEEAAAAAEAEAEAEAAGREPRGPDKSAVGGGRRQAAGVRLSRQPAQGVRVQLGAGSAARQGRGLGPAAAGSGPAPVTLLSGLQARRQKSMQDTVSWDPVDTPSRQEDEGASGVDQQPVAFADDSHDSRSSQGIGSWQAEAVEEKRLQQQQQAWQAEQRLSQQQQPWDLSQAQEQARAQPADTALQQAQQQEEECEGDEAGGLGMLTPRQKQRRRAQRKLLRISEASPDALLSSGGSSGRALAWHDSSIQSSGSSSSASSAGSGSSMDGSEDSSRGGSSSGAGAVDGPRGTEAPMVRGAGSLVRPKGRGPALDSYEGDAGTGPKPALRSTDGEEPADMLRL